MPDPIASSLRRLRGLHQRLSLCRVTMAPGCDSRLAPIDDHSLIAELADDASLIVIFIHPPGVGDEAAACGVSARLQGALRDQGIPLGALRIAILHCDASALDESDATLDAIMDLASCPLLSVGGFAEAVSS